MFEKPTGLHTIGLAFDQARLWGVQLTLEKGAPVLERIFEFEIDPAHVNPLDISKDGQQLTNLLEKHLAVTSISSLEVLVRPLDIRLKKEKEIDSVLSFQAEPLLPFPLEQAILDRYILGPAAEGFQTTILAVRKDQVTQHLSQWQAIGVEPEVVICEPAALAAFSKNFCTSTQTHFIVDLGRSHTSCAMIQDGKLLAAQSSHWGLLSLEQAASQDTNQENPSQIDLKTISAETMPHLYEAVQGWRLEIARLIHSLAKQRKSQDATEIMFTGEGSTWLNLSEIFCQELGKTQIETAEFPKVGIDSKQLKRLAIPFGNALSALPNMKERINFRQQEIAYPHPWKRLKNVLLAYFAGCLGLAISLYFLGNAYASYQESHLKQEFIELLASMNQSYEGFEKDYSAKYLKQPNYTEVKVDNLSLADINERLHYIHKDLRGSPDTFPLFPNVPKVSDVLAWLSTHPIALGQNDNSMQIDSLNYTLVKRPDPKKPQEKYQVKIEMEFASPTPKLAREFHDALIAPNELVDPKGEVKWSSNKGKYKASFYLKDRTVYPNTRTEGSL